MFTRCSELTRELTVAVTDGVFGDSDRLSQHPVGLKVHIKQNAVARRMSLSQSAKDDSGCLEYQSERAKAGALRCDMASMIVACERWIPSLEA
ncbi:hypothetical protein [Caballeronia sp. 15715]|uniref:hypothetical protein n=1 Tax=unclassified Caballeronia TaxID=2646786 RepID=UPI0039E6C5D9